MAGRRQYTLLVRPCVRPALSSDLIEAFLAIGQGKGSWAASYAKAKAIVGKMTNDEKENVTIGYTSENNGCSGNSGGVPRLGYPGMCFNDAGNGISGTEGANAYPAGVHVGASWNKKLAYQRGHYMGAEFKAKGGECLEGSCADCSGC